MRVSDHGFSRFDYGMDERFTELMDFLGREYARQSIVMQLHLGPIRNNSPKLMKSFGPDAGGDSVGYTTDPYALSAFLGKLEAADALPKTILYNLNPADNGVLYLLRAARILPPRPVPASRRAGGERHVPGGYGHLGPDRGGCLLQQRGAVLCCIG